MKLTIHRGTNQIGGCITEISHDGYKLFIDLGEQLPGAESTGQLSVEGLTEGDVSKSALFITHYHPDHIGKILDAHPKIPVYMGATALELYSIYENHLSCIPDEEKAAHHRQITERLESFNTFLAGKEFNWGTIHIIPLMVDHSAFDAYMFVIEAGGVRLLYTGDFRKHGFRGKALSKMLFKFGRGIDYVISEGTNVYRAADNESESALQKRFKEEFRQHKHNFILASSTHIDRVFSLYHAAREANRIFVCDRFQKRLMDIVSRTHKLYSDFYRIRQNDIYVLPIRQSDKSFYISQKLMYLMKRKGFCIPIRDNDRFWNVVSQFDGVDATPTVYYSLWRGYLDEKSPAFNQRLFESLSRYPDYKYMHTSGHCDIGTLEFLFKQVKPKKGIIPIHTELPERFKELFGHLAPIVLLRDGETYDCNQL